VGKTTLVETLRKGTEKGRTRTNSKKYIAKPNIATDGIDIEEWEMEGYEVLTYSEARSLISPRAASRSGRGTSLARKCTI
jgi:hypothetical protein